MIGSKIGHNKQKSHELVLVLLIIGCLFVGIGKAEKHQQKKISQNKQGSMKQSSQSSFGSPLLVIGADGFDLDVINALIARGKLPNLAYLIETGAHGILLSERYMRSPALWTTIATGRPRAVHGIYDFITGSFFWPKDQQNQKKRLVTSDMRKVPALWNMVEKQTMAVIGWMNTWPAEKINGIMVSPYVALDSPKQITIKGTVYPDIPNQVYPDKRWKEIRPLIMTSKNVPADLVKSFTSGPDSALLADYPILKKYMRGLRWSLAHTLTMRNITQSLLQSDNPDITFVYFEGSDSLGHRFWLFRQTLAEIREQLESLGYPTAQVQRLKERFGNIIDQYYITLDAILGELIDEIPDGHLVLVSDHGFTKRSKDHPPIPEVPFTGEHRIEGTIIIQGPSVISGKQIVGATLYDVVPTILDLIHVKSDIAFEGKSLVPQIKISRIKKITAKNTKEDEDQSVEIPFSKEELDRLRSLGYVE